MSDFISVQNVKAVERRLATIQHHIEQNGHKMTNAYARVVAAEVRHRAPKRRGKAAGAAAISTKTGKRIRANLARHVKVYPEGRGKGNRSATSSKIKLTGHVWHLITGDVKEHEEVAGTFRGKPSGKRALQMLDGYATRALHPAHRGEPILLEAHLAVQAEAMAAARAALKNG